MDEQRRKQGVRDSKSDPEPKKKTAKSKKKFSYKKLIIGLVVTGIVGTICALGVYILVMMNGSRLLEQNKDKFTMAESTVVLDRNDAEATLLYRENREIVDDKDIPDLIKKAFVATEDRRFYTHSGVDLFSIGRAIVKDVVARSAVEGGSTITQQLAKNLFFEQPDKTFFRKATEASIAVALENKYTKDEIISMYLNRIYFGEGAYGIKTAAKVYFGQDLGKLDLAQIATLAALPKAPNTYSPVKNPDKSKERRAVVLQLMKDEGYITEEQRAAATAEELKLTGDSGKSEYMTFIDYVVQEAEDEYKIPEDQLRRNGYKIYTTLDKTAQNAMESSYANDKLFQAAAKDGTKIQSSMVIVDNADGGLVAMIGGRNYKTKDLNRAFSKRQPGSSFKPVSVYAQALESGDYNPFSMLDDTKRCYGSKGDYCPNNYNGKYDGKVTMMQAIKESKNISAVSTLQDIGVMNGLKMAQKLGVNLDPKKDNNLAIALGGLTNGASPLEMAGAYSVFANNGVKHKTHAIRKIVDADGSEVAAFKDNSQRIIQEQTAYYLTKMMQTVLEPGGTGTRAKLDRPAAGKTGSAALTVPGFTKYDSDVWFVGYTPQWTAAVWEGFDRVDTKLGHYVTVGSGSTAAIFKDVMTKAMAKLPKKDFVRPQGVPELKEPPKPISDLTAVFDPATRSVKLAWSAFPDAAGYKILRKGYNEDNFSPIGSSVETTVNDIGVVPGQTYLYKVVPMLGDKESQESNTAEAAVPALSNEPSPSPGEISPGPSDGPYGPQPSPSPSPGEGGITSPLPSPGTSPTQGVGGNQDGSSKVNAVPRKHKH